MVTAKKMEPSDDDRTKPTSYHFMKIAVEMEGFSLPVIAASLSYRNEEGVATISCKNTTQRNKIAELLCSWKNENPTKCTWTDLKSCIKHLNNQKLMDFVDGIANIEVQEMELIVSNTSSEIDSFQSGIYIYIYYYKGKNIYSK